MMAVTVRAGRRLEADRPRILFEGRFARRNLPWLANYDVSADGRRFLMIQHEPGPEPGEIQVVLNWFDDVERILGASEE
jgi:hypothetical protein